jgi:hypothetical protein
MIRGWTRAALLASVALGAGGCSALLDWNDFSGGDDGGTVATCAAPQQCTAAAPAGWSGPVELYTAPTGQGAPPACGSGFDSTPAFDGNGDLSAPPVSCSPCSCGVATGVTCVAPAMTFYLDDSCGTPISTMIPSSTCTPTTLGAMSVTVGLPTASAGACAALGGMATATTATWGTVARACVPSASPASGGCDPGQVCAPAASSPFSTRGCVVQSGVASACPAGFPAGPQVFYSGLDDQRACSACTCSPPNGGACTIDSPAIETGCLASTGTLSAPSACMSFTGPVPVKLIAQPTLVDAGVCALTGGGAPSGMADGTGAMSFCCAL